MGRCMQKRLDGSGDLLWDREGRMSDDIFLREVGSLRKDGYLREGIFLLGDSIFLLENSIFMRDGIIILRKGGGILGGYGIVTIMYGSIGDRV